MKRTQSGSTLIYGIAAFLAVALIFGFIALNYQQLFGYHKQAQNSVDAAAHCCRKRSAESDNSRSSDRESRSD
jgi:bacteriorhodopsin